DDGTFKYLPLEGFQGIDVFHVKVTDGYLDGAHVSPSGATQKYITVIILVTLATQIGTTQVPDDEYPNFTPTDFNSATVQVPVHFPGVVDRTEYVRLETDRPVKDFQPIANPSPVGDLPPGTQPGDFPVGFFRFTVALNPDHAAALVKLSLPGDAPAPTRYF